MKLINFVLFQFGWFVSVWGAAQQKLPLSMTVVALILLVHIMQASQKKEATILLFIIMLLGSIFDQLLLITNLVTYENQFIDYLVPIWIVAMWGLFATTLNLSLSWLKSNRVLAVLFGFIGGPAAYFAAEQLNAVQLTNPFSIYALALGWAILTPVCLYIAQKWNGFRT
ncbi:conserved membrane protein of unknown function [Candidatus Methylopumilus planktonicus]|uniref:DUF2878 domain-containing protein n=1 Tax=Candidatus Methylopumilus planktonicus TaxID=1581557 RepID=A0A0D6EWU6_9PROT|nr:DUF2878 domain-containing protein [Candidatus Methylopumilus planktonicus]CEZ20107.1 conserved membrane protein of unknown function [Candidatus Methylopumilus planktonicus]